MMQSCLTQILKKHDHVKIIVRTAFEMDSLAITRRQLKVRNNSPNVNLKNRKQFLKSLKMGNFKKFSYFLEISQF